MKPLLLVLALLLTGRVAGASTVVITVGDNFYSPQTVTIHVGDVVAWQYSGSRTHPTASDNGNWATFILSSSTPNGSVTFNKAGTFPYHCTAHGAPGVGMYGVITVAAALPVQPAQAIAAAFRVYPNPAATTVTLALARQQPNDHSTVQVVNMLGSLVRTIAVQPELTGHDLTLSVADLPAGIYAYRLLVNNQLVATQRLILSR